MAANYVCPDCAFEWPGGRPRQTPTPMQATASCAMPYVMQWQPAGRWRRGDPGERPQVKGSSSTLKKGTKIKSIRLVDGADGHNVDCKTDLGSMLLKSEFLKKA